MSTKDIDCRVLGEGHYSLLIDGHSYEVFVRPDKNGYLVEVNGHLIPVRPEEAENKTSPKDEKGTIVVESPMPGRVIGIKVVEGDIVKAGDGLIIVEAMKMENELVSPKAGRVRKIAVKVGQAVEAGQELVTIE